MSLLQVEDLRVVLHTQHGVVHAVNGIDLELEAGETHAVAGESGSGKSITAASIVGLLPPRSEVTGRIVIAGEEQLRLKERQRRQSRGQLVGMIFQDPNAALDPVRRVGGQVAEALWATGMSRKDARARSLELLAEVGLYNPRRTRQTVPF